MTETLGSKLNSIEQNGRGRTLGERAFSVIHDAIVTGLLAPGERLPIEAVASGLDMSPMPVREALGRLHEDGLVDVVPHRGASVMSLTVEDLHDLYLSRLALEPVAAASAARRFDADDAERAREALERHSEAAEHGTPVETFTAHTAFHFAIYEASGRPWLVRLIRPLWESSQRYRLSLPKSYRRLLRERRAEHERMLDACIDGDACAAGMEVYNHLVRTAERIAVRMGQDPMFESIDLDAAAALLTALPERIDDVEGDPRVYGNGI
jgi:DNA-binding GntR family transcriptional regulator